jgi:gluconolactonase
MAMAKRFFPIALGLQLAACSTPEGQAIEPTPMGAGGGLADSGASAGGSAGSEVAPGGDGGMMPSSGGSSGSSGGEPSVAGSQGMQADPGVEGDGEFPQPEPYPAPADTLARTPGAPIGNISPAGQFTSSVVYPGLKFQFWVYVPAQYQPGKPAALMVFQDGIHYLGLSEAKFNSLIVFDNLIHAGEMPVTIALFVQPGTYDGVYTYPSEESGLRSDQYDTPSDAYSKFLLDEIIPAVITSSYDVVDDPNGWAISGHSSGGICAFMVGWYRPDKFRKLLTHNASFPNTDGVFPAEINATDPAKPLRVYLLSSPNDIGGWFDANSLAYDYLAAKGYHVRYRTGSGLHFPPIQAVSDYPDALRWMWRGYTLPWYSP